LQIGALPGVSARPDSPSPAPNRNANRYHLHSQRPRNACATPAQRLRNVNSAHIGSGEGARREPPRQQRATIQVRMRTIRIWQWHL